MTEPRAKPCRSVRPKGPGRRLAPQRRECRRFGLCLAAVVVMVAMLGFNLGRVFADEHSGHHGGSESGGSRGEEMGGTTSGEMGGMMGEHGGSRYKPLFPSLMSMPSVTPEQRAQVEQSARQRMEAGSSLMSQGLAQMSSATASNDFAAMQEASELISRGLDQYQSGLAASRALAEGKAPRDVALSWFKQQMSLAPPVGSASEVRILGLPLIHFFSMALLIAFAAAMIWLYFLRMHRAQELLRLTHPPPVVPPAGGPAPADVGGTQAGQLGPAPPPSARQAAPTGPPSVAISKPPSEAITSVSASKTPRWSGKLKVLRTFDETPEVRTFRLGDPGSGQIPFTYLPGQFLDLTVSIDGRLAKRSYSISSSPTERDYVEITVKREPLGVVSGYLHDQVREGSELSITAPAGRFTFTGTEADSIVLIGGGVGITPLMSVIRYLTARGWRGDIWLLYCFREPRDFIFRQEIEYLQSRHPNLTVVVSATRRGQAPWVGLTGRFTKEIIAQAVPGIVSRRIHLCGPPPMMDAFKGILTELGVSKNQIRTEGFGTEQRNPEVVGARAVPVFSPAAARVNGVAVHAPTVLFSLSKKSATIPLGKSVLEASEDVGVNLDFSCRVGTCGTCTVKLVSGRVTMEVEEGLDPQDKQLGYILACQAKSNVDLVVEA